MDTATLAVSDSLARRANPRAAGLFGGIATLSGTFAAYSPAWSPHFHGRLLRGALRLSPGRSGTDTPGLDGTNRYFDPVPGAIAADIVELGLNVPEADRLDAFTREFLGTSPNQVTTQDQTTFASMLDREHLDAAR
jgi:hypothetical protein